MADWSIMDHEWPPNQFDPYQYGCNLYYQDKTQMQYMPSQAQPYTSPSPQAMALLHLVSSEPAEEPPMQYAQEQPIAPKGDNPREIRKKTEKQRRDKLNQSIAELAAMVPPVVAASRKIDKTGILRLTAHYLRSHHYVFGDSLGQPQDFSPAATQALLAILNGFLLTCTYKGLIVVASQNIQQYLGYNELELLGQNVFNLIHEDDRQVVRELLMPKSHLLGPNGELIIPDEPNGKKMVADALTSEKRRFVVRFKKLSQRSEPSQYVTCQVEGSLRKSDQACRGYNRCCQMVRRARARGDNPCSSGNDIVFVGIVRPVVDTFVTESNMESFRMEYRTRHSIDGQIIQSEQRIALVTGYMTHEVNGVNAMNFMHRDDVRWVIIALREMYDQHRLVGESCYRLMTKNGQFIYMRTRGRLDVDQNSRAVTSFVCTNTVVDEKEGIQLIKMMKKKFTLMVNNNEEPLHEEDPKEVTDNQELPVEDPRQLEKVILHLVTNLPSPEVENPPRSMTPEREGSPSLRLAIIPPKKERIVSAIEKIYTVINTLPKERGNKFANKPGHSQSSADVKTIMPLQTPTNFQNENNSLPSMTMQYKNKSDIYPESTQPDEVLPTFKNLYPTYEQQNVLNMVRPAETVTSSSYSGKASVSFLNIDSSMTPNNDSNADQPENINYHAYFTNNDNKRMNQTEIVNEHIVTPGLKRPACFQDQEVNNKKKVAEVAKQEDLDQLLDQETPSLDTFFDEALLNTPFSQIDTAIRSLEHAIIDPTFLISNEVQDILSEIDETSDENADV